MTHGGSSIPEVQRLLAVLAAGRRVAEAGTAFGEGAAALASTATEVVTVESDLGRAAQAAERLSGLRHVEALRGDWRQLLPPRAPFQLLFLDAGGFKTHPCELGEEALAVLEPGGLLVVDDFTPGTGPAEDPARSFLFDHDRLVAAEVLTTPQTAAIVAVVVAE